MTGWENFQWWNLFVDMITDFISGYWAIFILFHQRMAILMIRWKYRSKYHISWIPIGILNWTIIIINFIISRLIWISINFETWGWFGLKTKTYLLKEFWETATKINIRSPKMPLPMVSQAPWSKIILRIAFKYLPIICRKIFLITGIVNWKLDWDILHNLTNGHQIP